MPKVSNLIENLFKCVGTVVLILILMLLGEFSARAQSADPTPKTEQPPSLIQEEIQSQQEDARKFEILNDLEALPFPVRKMRTLLLEAAISGDIEKLRPFIGKGDDMTMLSLSGVEGDAIDFLKTQSGDNKGHEILAIMIDILQAPFVRLDPGSEQESYVWPYFAHYPLEKLTDEQRVQLFRIVTYGDYEEMQSLGFYMFYRLGISPQGRWRFFIAGD